MAQEKPLDNRDREAVGLNTPVEGLNVSGPGKYYPADYSAQIQAYGRRTEMMSKIPESMAKIIEYADDYKINAYNNKEQTELYKKGLENELYKNTLELDSANRVNAKTLLMKERLVEAKRKADESNGDITLMEAYNEVFNSDEFRNPEEFTSLNSQKNWQHQYDSLQQECTVKAMENDILNVQAEMGMNIGHAISISANRCLSEGLDPEDAMNEYLKTIFLYRKHITAKDLRTYNNQAWSALVKGFADYAVANVASGDWSVEQGEETLKRLLNTTAYKKFVYLDKDGNAEKDADGEDATLTVALSEQDQAYLLSHFKTLQNKKGSGKEDIDLAGYWKNLTDDLGLPENFDIDKSGELKDVLKGMLGKSNDDLAKEVDTFMQYVLNSGATPSQIGTYSRKGVKLLALVDAISYAREMMTAKGVDPSAVKDLIVRMGQRIDNGLSSSQDPREWDPLRVSGTVFNSRLDYYSKWYGLPERVDNELISRGYFRDVSEAFKTFANMDADSLLTYLDSDVYRTSNTMGAVGPDGQVSDASAISARDVLKDEGTGIPRINEISAEKEANDLRQLDGVMKARGGMGISEESITKRIKDLQIDTPLKAAWFAKAHTMAGTTGSLERFASKHITAGKDDKYYEISQNILAGLLLTSDADLEQKLGDYYAANLSENSRYEAYKQFSQGKNKILAEEINLVLSRNKIPGAFRPAMQQITRDMLVMYAQKGEGKSQLLSRVNKLINNNFVELNHMYDGQLVYKHADALKYWKDTGELNSSLNSIYDFVKSNTGVKVDFLPDSESGQFKVMIGGESLPYPVRVRTPHSLGIKPDSPRSKQFITQLAGKEAVLELNLKDDKRLEKLAIEASKKEKVMYSKEDVTQCLLQMSAAAKNSENIRRVAKRYVEQGYDEYYKKWRVAPQVKPYFDSDIDISGLIKGNKTWFGDNSFVSIDKGFKRTAPHDLITLPRPSKFGYGDGAVQSVQSKKYSGIINALFVPGAGITHPQEGAFARILFEESEGIK